MRKKGNVRKINGNLSACAGAVAKSKSRVGKNLAEAEHHVCDADVFLLGVYIGIKLLQHGKYILGKTASGIPDTDMKTGTLIFFLRGDIDMHVQHFPHNLNSHI